MEKVKKPMLLAREDLVKQIADAVNNCDLPPIIVLGVLEIMYQQAAAAVDAEYKKEKEEYEKAISGV